MLKNAETASGTTKQSIRSHPMAIGLIGVYSSMTAKVVQRQRIRWIV